MRLRHQALQILLISDPQAKAAAALALRSAYVLAHPTEGLDEAERQEALALSADQAASMPGRPARPALVSATQVPSRSPFTQEGRAALLHAICHIEFNAIKTAFSVGN